MYDNILKVFADMSKSVGVEVLERARKDGLVSDKEYLFYKDTVRKRVLSVAQKHWRIDINRKIVTRYVGVSDI